MVKHIVDTRQLKDRRFLEGLFSLADKMQEQVMNHSVERKHEGKVVLNFFFKIASSTRTRTSFESAAKRLGADVVTIDNAEEFSSLFKGESLEHTLLATQGFFDAVVMRHPEDGGAKRAAYILNIPFINAGDGKNQHPTQALLDLYTLRQKFQRIDNLKIGFLGDIRQGRTIRSGAYLLAHGENNELVFISPPELGLPDDMKSYLLKKGTKFHETEDIDAVLPSLDALYVTRLQWEHIQDKEERMRLMESYKRFQITSKRANMMGRDSIIMHPLPINTQKSDGFPEITPDVDTNDRAWYFVQSRNGLYVRMALLDVLLTADVGNPNSLYNLILDVPKDS